MRTSTRTTERRAPFRALGLRAVALTVLCGLLGASAGIGLAARRGDVTVAKATILVDPLEGNPYFPSGNGGDLLNLETEAELVRSDQVALLVSKALRVAESPSEMLAGLSVDVRPNTQILDIEYAAAARPEAIRRAQAFAEVFLDFRRSRAAALVFDQQATIHDQLAEQSKELDRLVTARAHVKAGSPRSSLLREQIGGVTAQISQLRTQLAELTAGSSDPGQVVTPAAATPRGLLDSPVTMALGGLLAGLGLAAGLASLTSSKNRRLRFVEDIENLGLTSLGRIAARDAAAMEARLAAKPERLPPLTANDQKLRVTLLTRDKRRPLCVLLATSSAGIHRPTTGMGLAVSLASARLETVVVDAAGGTAGAIDRPGLTDRLGLSDAAGLRDLLLGKIAPDDALVPLGRHLKVLPAGRFSTDAADLMLSAEMTSVLGDLKKRCDVLLLLAGPLQEPTTEALAAVAATVVVEAAQRVTRLRELADLDAHPALAGHFLGIISVEGSSRRRPGSGT